MHLVDDDARNRQPMSQHQGTLVTRSVQADRMPGAHERVDAFDDLHRVVEVARAIDGQHRAQLLAGKWVLGADTLFLDHQHLRLLRDNRCEACALGDRRGRLADDAR